MAAMTPMKRKMSSTRGAKRSRYTKLIPTVVDAITEAESLPAGVRTLLKTSLPIVLNIDKADRHAYEAEVVGQAQQALGIVQNALEQEHATAMSKQNVVIAPAEEARRHAAKKSAEEHLEAAKGKLEASKAAKKACEKSEAEAEDAMKAAQKEAKTADKALQGLVGKREHLTSSLANEFVALKEGSIAAAAAKKAIHEVIAPAAHGTALAARATTAAERGKDAQVAKVAFARSNSIKTEKALAKASDSSAQEKLGQENDQKMFNAANRKDNETAKKIAFAKNDSERVKAKGGTWIHVDDSDTPDPTATAAPASPICQLGASMSWGSASVK